MPLDPRVLERVVSSETGLSFKGRAGVDAEGQRWYLLRPRDLPKDHTFSIRVTLGWRRLFVNFEPGKFASELLADMGNADSDGRAAFNSVCVQCSALGARIDVQVNGIPLSLDRDELWAQTWNRVSFSLNIGPLELDTDDDEHNSHIICRWTSRFAAAVVSILPVEDVRDEVEPDVIGYPEGALSIVQTNRYERDRRNRAAAIAIHGYLCKGCGLDMGRQYGAIAEGFIQIHHITPVSQLGEGYVIDPARDLVPLCPNCHAVVHRRDPPLDVDEIRQLLE